MRAAWRCWRTDIPTALRSLNGAGAIFCVLFLTSGCRTIPPEEAYRGVAATFVKGDLPKAEKDAADFAASFERNGPREWFWKFRLLEAEAMLGQARIAEASKLLATPIPAEAQGSQLEVQRLINQADALSKSRRLQEAVTLLEQVRPRATDAELRIRMDLLEGAVLSRLGKLGESEELLKRAAERAVKRGDAYLEASALLNLSYCRKQAFQYSEGTAYALNSLALAEKAGAQRLAAGANANLGSFYAILGDFTRSEQHQDKAIGILSAIHDRGNLLIALGERGLLHTFQGRYQEGIEIYARAFNLAQELKSDSDAARTADNLATAYIELRQWEQAEMWNRRAASISAPESGSGPYITLNAGRIAEGRGQRDEAIRLYEEVGRQGGVYPGLLWESHSLLGHVHADGHSYAAADREYAAALEVIEKTRSDVLKSELKITFLSRLIHFFQEYVDELVGRGDDAGALRIIESARARVLAERLGQDGKSWKAMDLARLRQLCRSAKISMLSYWIAPKRSFAWLITGEGVQRFELPPAQKIEELVAAYRKVVEQPLVDPLISRDVAGARLWDAVMAPIAPHIPKNTRVAVIPDGALHRLNLETLITPAGHYWVEDAMVAIAPSLTVAAFGIHPPERPGGALLVIGAPDYKGTQLTPLAKAESEIRGIRASLPAMTQTVLLGSQATPGAYYDSKPARFSLIHFSAHAEASSENPLESAVILSHQADRYKLYAREVINVPIQADLVTISGCKSAGVRAYAGEGLIGFAWAFLQAGARAVIAGLWDVSDSSTEPLMHELYRGIAAKQSPIAALRQAKLKMLGSAYGKAYYWGPFQVYVRAM